MKKRKLKKQLDQACKTALAYLDEVNRLESLLDVETHDNERLQETNAELGDALAKALTELVELKKGNATRAEELARFNRANGGNTNA